MLSPRCTTVSAAVSSPLSAAALERQRERTTHLWTHSTHKVLLCCSQTSMHSPPNNHHTIPVFLSLRHLQTNLHLNSPTVGCTFCSITSFPVAECWSELTFLCSVLLVYFEWRSWQEVKEVLWTVWQFTITLKLQITDVQHDLDNPVKSNLFNSLFASPTPTLFFLV